MRVGRVDLTQMHQSSTESIRRSEYKSTCVYIVISSSRSRSTTGSVRKPWRHSKTVQDQCDLGQFFDGRRSLRNYGAELGGWTTEVMPSPRFAWALLIIVAGCLAPVVGKERAPTVENRSCLSRTTAVSNASGGFRQASVSFVSLASRH